MMRAVLLNAILLATTVSVAGRLLAPAAPAPVLHVTYETGTIDSGVEGLTGTAATAANSAFVSNEFAREGTCSIGHKVVLGDSACTSHGAPHSESDTLSILDTRCSDGTELSHQFSFLLHNWMDWLNQGIPNDVIWQFKHTQGGPDGFFGIKRNSLVMRYNSEARLQFNIVPGVRPFDDQWTDMKCDIRWRDDDSGMLKAWVKTPADANFQLKVDKQNFKMFTDAAGGEFGCLKCGLCRSDSTVTNDAITCEIHHDNVTVSELAQ